MKVKMIGIQSNTTFCAGSGGAGLSFICAHMVTPMMIGQMPRCRKEPNIGSVVGSTGISPNRLKMLVGSGAERSWIQPRSEERRVGKECRSRWWASDEGREE